jgi:uncharacterized membrane protein
MKAAIPLALLALAGCATSRAPFSPVSQVDYSAVGHEPFWMVTIGDDSIVLTLGAQPGTEGRLSSHRFARVLPNVTDGVTRWESGDGTAAIAVEARPGPCTGSRGRRYRDQVTVSLSGRQLDGCGGPMLPAERR